MYPNGSHSDRCLTHHCLALYFVLYPFHAISGWANQHHLCQGDDHAVQRCQLQLLSDLQRGRQSCPHCEHASYISFQVQLLIVTKGPFTIRVTSDYLLVTQIGCIPSPPALGQRHALPETTPEPTALFIRGAKPSTLTPIVKTHALQIPKPLDLVRRQVPTNSTLSPPVFPEESSRLLTQLHTVIYAFGVINSGADLGEACLQLQSANAILDLPEVGLDAVQAADIICSASSSDADIRNFNQTVIVTTAAALYGVQVASNFTGTIDSGLHCNELDYSPLSAYGVDTNAIQNYICSAANATATTTGNGSTLTANVTSAGTPTPFPFTNASAPTFTWAGSVTVTGPVASAGTAPWGTGLAPTATGFYPTVNVSTISGSIVSGTAVVGTGELPVGTGIVGTGATGFGIGGFPTATFSVGNSTAVVGTGTLPVTTVDAGNATAALGTGNVPIGTAASGTGVFGPTANETGFFGTGVPATGNLPIATGPLGTGIGVPAAGDVSTGYATSSAYSWPSQAGYYRQKQDGHLPHGPTSTPRYYPRDF